MAFCRPFFSSESEQQKARWRKQLGKGYEDWLFAVPPVVPEMRQAWDLTAAILREASREVKSRGVDFLLVGLTNAIQVHYDKVLQQRYKKQFKVGSLTYADQRLRDIAEEYQIPIFQLADPMQAQCQIECCLVARIRKYALRIWPLERKGHRVAAGLVADRVCDDQSS